MDREARGAGAKAPSGGGGPAAGPPPRDAEAPAGGAAEARDAGLAHVAAVSFLASRATPFGGFLIALPGGVALARAGERRGRRRGFGASLAAMLQSVAMVGPTRFGVPLTQAIAAPIIGRMEASGRGVLAQVLACAAVRTVQNVLETAFFILVITGLDAYAATYDELVAGFLTLPAGRAPALLLTALLLLVWSAFASTVQVLVYRRGLARWRGEQPVREPPAPAAGEPAEQPAVAGAALRPRRFDPRAVTLAAVVAFCLLLASTSWVLIGAVGAWLVVASLAAARPDRDVVPAGVALATILAASAFAFAAIGGLGMDIALRRAARAGMLVLVATWLRAAAGSEGLREVARRSLHRLRVVPSLEEATRALEELGATARIASAGRALFRSLHGVRKRPVAVMDAVLGWVRLEAVRFRPEPPGAPVRTGLRARDAALLALGAAPALALLTPT